MLEVSASEALQSLRGVQGWVERHEYRGYEPFDGLSSWARPLAFGSLLGERLLQQLIRQCPINLRPLMGVTPKESTKGRGYMAWGHLLMYRATRATQHLEEAVANLHWLDRHRVSRFRYHSWSNHFDFVSRGGGYTKDDPIIVWTSLIGHAFVEAFEITREAWFLEIAESVCNWILEVPREKTARGTCLSYFADQGEYIHNASMLGASILARTAKHTGSAEYVRVARAAVEYSCSRQHPNGSWWYAEPRKYQWIDNFHTGYVLDSLKTYIDATHDEEFRPFLVRGLRFFTEHFFEANGRPRYYHTRTYPIDIQCAAQAIDTLARFGEDDRASLALARRVARWSIRRMQNRGGHFYYRQYPLIIARTAMLHWGQATMFKALARLYLTMTGTPAPSAPGATPGCAA